MRNLCRACAAATLVALVVASAASAHARISPAVSLSKELQLYSLAVPAEKEGATTTKIVLTVPQGFSIDSFAPSPGWHRAVQSTGSGEEAVVQQVTWTGGSVPTGEDSLFQILGPPSGSKMCTSTANQTYSDAPLAAWNGTESSLCAPPT